MNEISRRRLLQLTGALTAGATLGACGDGDSAGRGGAAGANAPMTWWDFKDPIIDLAKQTHQKWGKRPVELRFVENQKMGQTLQLAKQSGQLPDVFTPQGLEIPLAQLVKEGWYQPYTWDQAFIEKTFKPDTLVEGMHTLDGKVYSFPLAGWRFGEVATWFNTELFGKANLDPANPPATYDDFRAAATAIRKTGGNTYGWIYQFGMVPRIRGDVDALAQAGGFEGDSGVRFRTGEYAFDDDAYLNAIEFLLAAAKDGSLFPASSNLNAIQARTRWATGIAGLYLDGPWNAGIVVEDFAPFAEKIGVSPLPVPEQGKPVTTYRVQQGGVYAISGSSKLAAEASDLLKLFTTTEYNVGFAEQMVERPLDDTAIGKAKVHETWRKYMELSDDAVFLAPQPMLKNPDVVKVTAEEKPVNPHLGHVVQGLLSGDVSDVRKALRDLNGRHEKVREAAIAKAAKAGAKVDQSAWAFPDWQPRTDYGKDKYPAR